jgi:hypothetical protein
MEHRAWLIQEIHRWRPSVKWREQDMTDHEKWAAKMALAQTVILSGPDTEAAFEDYGAFIRAYGCDFNYRIDGKWRESLEDRERWGAGPFDSSGESLRIAMLMAEDAGITMAQLADLFEMALPWNGEGIAALCVVEDAICILNAVPLPVERIE